MPDNQPTTRLTAERDDADGLLARLADDAQGARKVHNKGAGC